MTKKPRENRVPIMLSDEELQAIDDWRFSGRVATRATAMRKLIQIGMLFHGSVMPMLIHLSKSVGVMGLTDEQWEELLRQHEGDEDLDLYARRLAILLSDAFPAIQDTAYDAHDHLLDMMRELVAILEAPTIPDGLAGMEAVRREARERLEQRASEDADPNKSEALQRHMEARKLFAETQDVSEALELARQFLDVGKKE